MKNFPFYLLILFFSAISFADGIPNNAHKNPYSSGWSCDKGFKKSGNSCVAVNIPKNAKLTYLGNNWECIKGYKKSGNSCVAVNIPKNAKLTYLGNNWECQKGFKKSGNSCVAVNIPKNAKLTYLGNNWECQKGFKKSGNSCIAVTLPDNAKLSYLGNSWECNKNFKKSSNSCVKMTAIEIKKQQEIEQAVRVKMQQNKDSLSDGTIAFQTKISSDSGDVIKLENGAIVEVSSYLGYLGYRKTAVLYGSGNRCHIWIAGKKSYKCDLLKSPNVKGQPAKEVHISDVKGNGTILIMLDGSMFEVDSIDEIYTSLWLGISDGLLINGNTLINFDSDEPVGVFRLK